ncbi:DUF3106 domain-containing protein [Rothia nasimurium]|uniref:DUF3106 domain-containing protein n=1 Tax=Luteibacter anthropi TaxID=564369 RepID=A0A7X5ZK39_9GAMM|nr:DUF3106 domain-containing protein [Luteibacter anthropi]NII08479.1 DUF3106 domain-containing protein [Luteibacter anthropi]
MRRLTASAVLLLALAAPVAAGAQDHPPPHQGMQIPQGPLPPPRAWKDLTARDQDVLKPLQQDWDGFPPDKKSRFLGKALQWRDLPDDKRAEIRDRIDHWQKMTPEERAQARANREKFKDLTPEQRQKLHDAFERFNNLSPDQRQAIIQKWHSQTPEQRRQWVDNIGPNDALPPPPPPPGMGPPPPGSHPPPPSAR